MSTMTDHAKNHTRDIKLVLQGAASLALLSVIFVGAVFYVADASFTEKGQTIAVIIGAIAGAIGAWGLGRFSAEH
jgi:hypothetical protein